MHYAQQTECDLMHHANVIKLLTYLGASPFFLAIFLSLSNQTFLAVEGRHWFLSYGLVILSFMAGTLWGQVLNASTWVKRIALATNAITLAAWFAFLLADLSSVLLITAVGFVALYLLESFAVSHTQRPEYYLGLRLRVTALVVLAHGIMFLLV